MNVFSFTGNLGRDAEQRFIPSGESVVSFSVAVKSGYGEKSVTTWAKCTMWGKRGQAVAQYLTKGQLVGVVGELTLTEFTNKDGLKQSSLEVRVNDLTLLGKKDGDQQVSQPARQERAPSGQAPAPASGGFADFSDDIPFLNVSRGISGHCHWG